MTYQQWLLEQHTPCACIVTSGLHGDEPAGDAAAQVLQQLPGVLTIAGINPSGRRRYEGRDLNRHFDTADASDKNQHVLQRILEHQPKLVINLHEDDQANGMYAYCSAHLQSIVQQAMQCCTMHVATHAHGDALEHGVVVCSKNPYAGTLERALTKRGIDYCTLETPSKHASLQHRAQNLVQVARKLIELISSK